MTDEQFFAQHPDRRARIRKPHLEFAPNRQRRMVQAWECGQEFLALGPHQIGRRRVILWRVPEGNPWHDLMNRRILKIPFLLFADETVEDEDRVLLPIIDELMRTANASVSFSR